jgi:hypothetical protein
LEPLEVGEEPGTSEGLAYSTGKRWNGTSLWFKTLKGVGLGAPFNRKKGNTAPAIIPKLYSTDKCSWIKHVLVLHERVLLILRRWQMWMIDSTGAHQRMLIDLKKKGVLLEW